MTWQVNIASPRSHSNWAQRSMIPGAVQAACLKAMTPSEHHGASGSMNVIGFCCFRAYSSSFFVDVPI